MYAFPLKPPNYLPKNFFLNKSLMNRDLLGNALRKGSRSLSICMPTSFTVAPAPFFVLLMFLLLFSISVVLYWFSIYSQKVALIDATPLRVLSWRAILLAGHTSIYQARQGVVFVGSLRSLPAFNPYRVAVVTDIISYQNLAVLSSKRSCQNSSFVLSLHVDFVQGFSVLLFCHCLLSFFNCLSNFVFIRFILCSSLPICLYDNHSGLMFNSSHNWRISLQCPAILGK